MTLPNLFVPGAAKSGTSSLHEYLNQHPDIFMSKMKEPHFWTSPEKYGNFEWYSAMFEESSTEKYRGESSTGYMVFDDFLERVTDYVEAPKFIFLLRNPIDRAYSHYRWLKGLGSEKLSFKSALESDKDTLPSHVNALREGNHKSYIQFSLYGKWMDRFFAKIPQEHIHIITTENLRKDYLKTVNSCFLFLQLTPLPNIDRVNANRTVQLKHPAIYRNMKIFQKNFSGHKRMFENFIGQKIELGISSRVKNILTKNPKNQDNLPSITRTWLKELLEEDVNLLKAITGMRFEEWEDFS